jgi:hypothetical protein
MVSPAFTVEQPSQSRINRRRGKGEPVLGRVESATGLATATASVASTISVDEFCGSTLQRIASPSFLLL